MIIFRYIFSETLKAQLAVFSVLLAIFTSQTLIRVLGDAMDGRVPTSLVFEMLTLSIPPLAGLILPLSLFIGIFLAHGQMYADSEMTVFKACGISEWYITRVTLSFALIITLITSLFTLYLTPLAYEKREVLRDEIRSDVGISAIVPGQFKESSNKKAVIFVHESEHENSFNRVFVAKVNPSSKTDNEFHVVYAKKGTMETFADGTEQLNLADGTAYSGGTNRLNFQITDFSRYSMVVKEQTIEEKRLKLMAVSSYTLWQSDELDSIAELQWRISLPLSVLIVALIAVPLARVKPRQGKFAKMVPAFAIYLCYFLLLMAGKSALEDGKLPSSIGLWWIHAGGLLYGGYLFTVERTLGRQLLFKMKIGRRLA